MVLGVGGERRLEGSSEQAWLSGDVIANGSDAASSDGAPYERRCPASGGYPSLALLTQRRRRQRRILI